MQKSMMLLATTMQNIFLNNGMKRIFCIAAFLIAVVSCAEAPLDRAEQLRDMILNGTSDYVIVVAHRGDWREVPENSIASIEHSIATGVDVVEVDLQMTKDSVLVLMHDETVDRTTTGTGRVADFILDSLQRLNLKHKGSLNVGADADVVIFDPERIEDRSDFASPLTPPVGIDYVIVNGIIAAKDGVILNPRAGKSVRK